MQDIEESSCVHEQMDVEELEKAGAVEQRKQLHLALLKEEYRQRGQKYKLSKGKRRRDARKARLSILYGLFLCAASSSFISKFCVGRPWFLNKNLRANNPDQLSNCDRGFCKNGIPSNCAIWFVFISLLSLDEMQD